MAKAIENRFSLFEQILITAVLVLIGLFATAYVGGWIDGNWDVNNAQIICKSVLYVLGLVAMWLIFADIAIKRVFKI